MLVPHSHPLSFINDFPGMKYEERKRLWNERFGLHDYVNYTNDGLGFQGSTPYLFRATPNEPNFKPSWLLSYVPLGNCAESRCNLANSSVLYTAQYPETALFECVKKPVDQFYITSWTVEKPALLKTHHFFHKYNGNIAYLIQLKLRLINDMREFCFKKGFNFEAHLNTFELITESFLLQSHAVSSFLSHYYMYERKDCNAIFYPSIEELGKKENIAFSREVVDGKIIRPHQVILCDILNRNGGSIEINVQNKMGIISDGNIDFKKVNDGYIASSEFRSLFAQSRVLA